MWHYSILFTNTNHVKKTIATTQQKGSVRIIGGQYRGKILHFPAIEGLRPTSDRIRETLFNWLMHDIRNARCLDLFAGSGALGFEAYSRGARMVVFVEHMRQPYLNIKQLITAFDATNLSVIHTAANNYLKSASEQYDIVFIDPPFAHPELFECIHAFEQSPLLADNGLMYLESPQEIVVNPVHWHLLKLKKTGQVTYALYQKKPSNHAMSSF